MDILGIIPARGGSKRLPGKNTRTFCGKPLIAWTLAASAASKKLTHCLVSTDDPQIAEIVASHGGHVPFLRPPNLAKDGTPMLAVVEHAVGWFEKNEHIRPEIVVLLQPTSPLRQSKDIDAALELLIRSKGDSIQSVSEDTRHPYHRYLLKGKTLSPLDPKRAKTPPSRMKKIYYPNGSLYAVKRSVLMERRSLQGKKHLGFITPWETSVDIDSLFDFRLAEWIHQSYFDTLFT